jgi:hypothetical protein
MFFAVLFAMFIFTIVAAYKPSIIEKEYNKIKEPISRHIAESNAKIWQTAKKNAWEASSKKNKSARRLCENTQLYSQVEMQKPVAITGQYVRKNLG